MTAVEGNVHRIKAPYWLVHRPFEWPLVSLWLSRALLWHALKPPMTPLVDPLALLQPSDRGGRSHTYIRDPLTPMDGPKTPLDGL